MAWDVEIDPDAEQDLNRLNRSVQREILNYLENKIGKADDPRTFGKPLRGSRFGLWRYRVRDYRIVCELKEQRLLVLVVLIGHRSTVYER